MTVEDKSRSGQIRTAWWGRAWRTRDCISIMGRTVGDAAEVRQVAEGFEPADPYSRRSAPRSLPSHGRRVGVLKAADREFFGDEDAAALYARAIERVGGTNVEIDFAPFRETAALRSEERREGKEGVSQCRSRWSPYH